MMFYIDLTIQFLTKMVVQFIPYMIILIGIAMLITFIKKDRCWLTKALRKLVKIN